MKRLRGRPLGNRQSPTCKDIAQVLQTFLDGELDETDIGAVQHHLDACRDCGLEADTYTAVKESLAARRRDIDPEVLERLRAFGSDVSRHRADQV